MTTYDLSPTLLVAATAIELLAVAAFAALLARAGRTRHAAAAALESLKADLGTLLDDAQRRARALEEALAAREAGLRTLLADVGRAETDVGLRARGAARTEGVLPPLRGEGDPAEARLLRDLEMRFARPRTA